MAYIHAFSTPSHHILVLEHVAGGELFDLVSSQDTHARLSEPLLRRIFGELCRAVAWMHAVGLVHRDIKLESTSSLGPYHLYPWLTLAWRIYRHLTHSRRVYRSYFPISVDQDLGLWPIPFHRPFIPLTHYTLWLGILCRSGTCHWTSI